MDKRLGLRLRFYIFVPVLASFIALLSVGLPYTAPFLIFIGIGAGIFVSLGIEEKGWLYGLMLGVVSGVFSILGLILLVGSGTVNFRELPDFLPIMTGVSVVFAL
ncbi:hypothetical protein KKE85_03245, partial [Patescibacteria group bacterium]|nr:hypothetical protein [Patescibacteria group bacterium]